jgi:hypothetical protein
MSCIYFDVWEMEIPKDIIHTFTHVFKIKGTHFIISQ